ncbi:MAG: hypothetical protein JSW51_01830 [Gemmatimonadota bacterium]|nr:MAG: hypothetical protein JSW51_01830 [Gemmatimonadota bacterium]
MEFDHSANPKDVEPALRAAVTGPRDDLWEPPSWLQPHQVEAAKRIHCSLRTFRFALLADAVGLGKTYVGLSVASIYPSVVVVVPAALRLQWHRVSKSVGLEITVQTHESLSRGAEVAPTDLVVVDEAHRLRNPSTRRYAQLARSVRRSRLLLLTATPVVNRADDLANMLRLALPDHAFAFLGLASLEAAVAGHDCGSIVHATASVIVARSPSSITGITGRLPKLQDLPVLRPPTTTNQTISRLLNGLDCLQFPSIANSQESALLKLHLLYRLSSSIDAFGETVRRHLAYVDRALNVALRGERLSRSIARKIFSSEYELQLELGDVPMSTGAVDASRLNADRNRLNEILQVLARCNGTDPKAKTLTGILAQRSDRKTVVFTSSVATAHRLAQLMRWHQVAVVGAGMGWIASGRLPVEQVLSLFAPLARGAPIPPKISTVNTLIATDFASEGLDLQDADAVVHYDLPWTPLKLEQRIGRIARLGSRHTTGQVWWFAPPHDIERRLELESRIAGKARCQLNLRVAATSRVGKAQIVNQLLDEREILSRHGSMPSTTQPLHAVVRGPHAAVAVRWQLADAEIPELMIIRGESGQLEADSAEINRILLALSSAAPSPHRPSKTLVSSFFKTVRQRLAAADRGPVDQTTRKLARHLVQLARAAGKRRNSEYIRLLDTILERLKQGVSVGAERTLEELLNSASSKRNLQRWLTEQPKLIRAPHGFQIIASIWGDGRVSGSPNLHQS